MDVAYERDGGSSLIEVLVAALVLCVGMAGVLPLVFGSVRATRAARDASMATWLAWQKAEQLRTPADLVVSPANALAADTAGYVDYPDQYGPARQRPRSLHAPVADRGCRCRRRRGAAARGVGVPRGVTRPAGRRGDRAPPGRGVSARPSLSTAAGFTVVELMASMATALVVCGALFTLVDAVRRTAATNAEVDDLQQRLRTALQTVAGELVNAGAGPDRTPLAGPLGRCSLRRALPARPGGRRCARPA